MAADTAKLLLEIDASVELLRRNLSRAESRLDDFGTRADRSLDRVDRRFDQAGRGALGVGRHLDYASGRLGVFGSALKVVAGGAAALLSADLLFRLAKAGLDYASSLGEQAQQLGVTTDTLQEYRFAATQVGLTQEQIDNGLQKLTLTLGQAAAGAKKPSAAFAALGVDITDTNGRIKETGLILPEIAEALSKIEDPARRARIEVALFGRSGQDLDTLLAGGAAAINNLRNAARELGVVLSSEQIQNADDAADKLAAIKQVLEARIAGVVSDNAQSIVELSDALAELTGWAIRALGALANLRRQMSATNDARRAASAAVTARPGESALQTQLRRNAASDAAGRAANAGRATTSLFGGLINIRSVVPPGPAASGPAAGSAPPPPSSNSGATEGGSGGRSNGGGRPRAGPSAAELAREAARNTAQFEDDIGQARVALLRSVADLTDAATARYAAEIAGIEEDRASFERQLALDQDLTEARRAALLQERDRLDLNSRAIAEQNLFIDREEDRVALFQRELDVREASLNEELDYVDSARRRLQIQLRLIDLAQQRERAELDLILATKATSSAEYQIAQSRLDQLDAVRNRAEDRTTRDNETPIKSFLRELNRSSDAVNEDLEAIAVDGLNSLNDGLVDAILNAESLGDVFSNVAEQIIADLLRIAIQRAVIEPLANSLFGGSGGAGGTGGGSGGFNVGSFFTSLFGGGRATGGPVRRGVPYIVGEAGEEVFVPRVDGNILSNATINRRGGGGSGGVTLAMTINAPGATAETVAMIRRELASAAPQIIKAARDVTLRSASRGRLP